MSVIYMGTSDFAVPALRALVEGGYDISLVVTQPDRPKGRGKKMQGSPVRLEAERLHLPLSTPEKLKGNRDFEATLKALAPALIVVAAYGRILPPWLLQLPARGCVNIHGSLLPDYRGAAPVHRAVIDGRRETGVSLMYMDEGLDTGDIIAQVATPIGEKRTPELLVELADLGADLLLETMPALLAGTAPRRPQDDDRASYAPRIDKADAQVDFDLPAEQVACFVRGMCQNPCAWTQCGDLTLKVHEALPGPPCEDCEPGTVLAADKEGILVSCGEGTILLKRIQAPGRKAMDAEAFLLGNKIERGTILG